MDKLFEGLYFYEVILIVLGTLMFIILLFILLYLVIKNRPFKKLGLLFIFPILMIAYSSIQKISYDQGMVSISKYTRELSNNPTDSNAIALLTEELESLRGREFNDPEINLLIGQAYLATGNNDLAIEYAGIALQGDSSLSSATQITSVANLDRAINNLESNNLSNGETSGQTRDILFDNVRILEKADSQDVLSQLKLAKAYKALDDTARALTIIELIKLRNPTLKHIELYQQ